MYKLKSDRILGWIAEVDIKSHLHRILVIGSTWERVLTLVFSSMDDKTPKSLLAAQIELQGLKERKKLSGLKKDLDLGGVGKGMSIIKIQI